MPRIAFVPVRRQAAIVFAFLSAAAASACSSDAAPNPVTQAFAQQPPETAGMQNVALRFEPDGAVSIYRLPALDPVAYGFELPERPQQVVGYSRDADMVYLVADTNRLVALDLASGRSRVVDTLVSRALLGPTNVPYVFRQDGSVAAVLNRRADQWADSLGGTITMAWGAVGNRLVVLLEREAGPEMAVLNGSWDGTTSPLPRGPTIASSWGDVVVVSTDSGLVSIQTLDPRVHRFLELDEGVTAMAFSASGHRVYVATPGGRLVITNRFDLSVLATAMLPGPVDAIRPDPLGRFVLYRPTGRDSIWVGRVESPANVVSIGGNWDDDLPTVSPEGAVIARDQSDIKAFDPSTGTETAIQPGVGIGDWIIVGWDPRRQALQVTEATAGPRDQPTGLQYYAQVSSTSNIDWAEDEVSRLRLAGMSATLLPQTAWDDRYRVGLGPFQTRQEAEENGRILGRAFFVISIDPGDTTGFR